MKRLTAILLLSVVLCAQPPVVIRGAKIETVAPDAAVPAGARLIDAAGQTLLPGLFDLHTHLSASAVTGLAGDWGKSLKAYLACGVTTVNDYATYGEMFAPFDRAASARRVKLDFKTT